mgnify:FL=1
MSELSLSARRRQVARSVRGAVLVLRCRREAAARPAACQRTLCRRWSHRPRRHSWLERCSDARFRRTRPPRWFQQCWPWTSAPCAGKARHRHGKACHASRWALAFTYRRYFHTTTTHLRALTDMMLWWCFNSKCCRRTCSDDGSRILLIRAHLAAVETRVARCRRHRRPLYPVRVMDATDG